jgi:copper resistance protein C
MTTALRRGVAVTLLAGLALLLGAAPAFAHARLESSDPADGASLDTAPQRVSLTFSDPMTTDFTTITVVGPDGEHYEAGDIAASGTTVSAGVQPLGPAGRYEIGFRVVSEDGHPVTGSVAFTMTTAGSGTGSPATSTQAQAPTTAQAPAAAAPASDDPDGGAPVWPWIVGAVVLVGGGVVAALRLGR